MKLFIGNVTPQRHVFVYRMLAEVSQKLVERPIAPGRQIEIGNDLARDEIDHILKQHMSYGLMAASDINQAKGYHGLCYSIDKPIPADKLTYLRERNIGALDDQGRELRRAAAIVGNEFLETALRENDRPEQVEQFDLYIQEDRAIDSDLPQVSEKIVVSRAPGQTPTPFNRNARRSLKRVA